MFRFLKNIFSKPLTDNKSKTSEENMSKFLIVGLGNVGAEYENTRHNIGFMVLDALAQQENIKFTSGRYAFTSDFRFRGKTIFLIKPTTYWLQYENIPQENLLVVTDDIALPIGTLRIKQKGSDGGHNGLLSVFENIGTTEYSRLRFGVGNDFSKGRQVDYVLGKWSKEEEKIINPKIDLAVDVIKSFVAFGPAKTMTEFNKKV